MLLAFSLTMFPSNEFLEWLSSGKVTRIKDLVYVYLENPGGPIGRGKFLKI